MGGSGKCLGVLSVRQALPTIIPIGLQSPCPFTTLVTYTVTIQYTLSCHIAIFSDSLAPEDEASMILWNRTKYWPNNTAPHPRVLHLPLSHIWHRTYMWPISPHFITIRYNKLLLPNLDLIYLYKLTVYISSITLQTFCITLYPKLPSGIIIKICIHSWF
jgi:hypothetical protein